MSEKQKRAPAHVVMLADLRGFIENYQELAAKHGQGWIQQHDMSYWFHEIKRILTDLNRIELPLKAVDNTGKELQEYLELAQIDQTLCDEIIQTVKELAEYGIELTPTKSDD